MKSSETDNLARTFPMMTHLDLFSGIGGFALAAKWTENITTVGFCEIEAYPQKVLKKNFPNIPIYPDIHQLTYEQFKKDTGISTINIITGGFPCQPFSQAGKRKGNTDDRHLWPEMLRVIREFKPNWIIGENVTGIISMELDQVLSDLEALNYSTRPLVIPACSIGTPHRRDRIWILAHSGCKRRLQMDEIPKIESENHIQKSHRKRWHNSFNNSFFNEGFKPLSSGTVLRNDDGIPEGLDRIKGLGNAIVPQVAYQILLGILNVQKLTKVYKFR